MPDNRPRICVVGSSNIDLTFRTSRLPRPGETIAGLAFQLGFGGKGANQAVMAAQLGACVTMVSKVGRDSFGEDIIRNFQKHDVDTTHVQIDEQRHTGVASIIVDEQARNCILVVPGANLGLSPADIQAAAAIIQSADVLICQLEVPVEANLAAFRLAKAAGVRTILNPAPAASLPDELLGLTDLCIPNETEVELLTGSAVPGLAEAEVAARQLLLRGPRTVIVTLGERGVLLVDGSAGEEHILPVPVQAVDPSGAGDAFIGSFAVFLAEGLPLRSAMSQANTVAALSVTRPGTQAAFPQRDEVEAFLAYQPGVN
jgi:ribokinase